MSRTPIDSTAFLKTYDELADALFRHSYFRVSNREVAVDMVQDTFMKAWKHISEGNEVDNLKAFVYKIMNNLIIDYYRKSKSGSLDDLLDDGFEPVDMKTDILHTAEISHLMQVLGGLGTADRDLVVKRYVDDLSIGEIARDLGETENVISVRLHRALQKLKHLYTNE